MKPDNKFSRYIRPGIMLWLTALFSTLMVIDGNFFGIIIKEAYISVMEALMVVVYGAYFVAKSAEHITRINNDTD